MPNFKKGRCHQRNRDNGADDQEMMKKIQEENQSLLENLRKLQEEKEALRANTDKVKGQWEKKLHERETEYDIQLQKLQEELTQKQREISLLNQTRMNVPKTDDNQSIQKAVEETCAHADTEWRRQCEEREKVVLCEKRQLQGDVKQKMNTINQLEPSDALKHNVQDFHEQVDLLRSMMVELEKSQCSETTQHVMTDIAALNQKLAEKEKVILELKKSLATASKILKKGTIWHVHEWWQVREMLSKKGGQCRTQLEEQEKQALHEKQQLEAELKQQLKPINQLKKQGDVMKQNVEDVVQNNAADGVTKAWEQQRTQREGELQQQVLQPASRTVQLLQNQGSETAQSLTPDAAALNQQLIEKDKVISELEESLASVKKSFDRLSMEKNTMLDDQSKIREMLTEMEENFRTKWEFHEKQVRHEMRKLQEDVKQKMNTINQLKMHKDVLRKNPEDATKACEHSKSRMDEELQ